MAVGNSGNIVISTDNGSSFDNSTSGTTNHFLGITYDNGSFTAVGYPGMIRTSSDGITWTSRTSGTTNSLNGVTYGNNKFLIVGNSGTTLTSSDGTSWTSISRSGDDASISLSDITYKE